MSKRLGVKGPQGHHWEVTVPNPLRDNSRCKCPPVCLLRYSSGVTDSQGHSFEVSATMATPSARSLHCPASVSLRLLKIHTPPANRRWPSNIRFVAPAENTHTRQAQRGLTSISFRCACSKYTPAANRRWPSNIRFVAPTEYTHATLHDRFDHLLSFDPRKDGRSNRPFAVSPQGAGEDQLPGGLVLRQDGEETVHPID